VRRRPFVNDEGVWEIRRWPAGAGGEDDFYTGDELEEMDFPRGEALLVVVGEYEKPGGVYIELAVVECSGEHMHRLYAGKIVRWTASSFFRDAVASYQRAARISPVLTSSHDIRGSMLELHFKMVEAQPQGLWERFLVERDHREAFGEPMPTHPAERIL